MDTINTSGGDAAKRPTGCGASKLRALRIKRGMTQRALSDASQVGIRQIQYMENGKIKMANITLKSAAALAGALRVDIEDLL